MVRRRLLVDEGLLFEIRVLVVQFAPFQRLWVHVVCVEARRCARRTEWRVRVESGELLGEKRGGAALHARLHLRVVCNRHISPLVCSHAKIWRQCVVRFRERAFTTGGSTRSSDSPQCRVPVVLDGIRRTSSQQSGDGSPLVSHLLVRTQNDGVLLTSPLVLANIGAQMVEPAGRRTQPKCGFRRSQWCVTNIRRSQDTERANRAKHTSEEGQKGGDGESGVALWASRAAEVGCIR